MQRLWVFLQNFTGDEAPSSASSRHLTEEESVLQKVESLLTWLTRWNFQKVVHQLIETIQRAPSAFVLMGLVSLIFQMAEADEAYVLFGRLCSELIDKLPRLPSDEPGVGDITFKRLLLNKCQMDFEEAVSQSELMFVDEDALKVRLLGNLRLLAELFKHKLIPEKICHHIIQVLLHLECRPEMSLEAICQFLSSIGKQADINPRSRRIFDLYFVKLNDIAANPQVTQNLRVKLRDLVDLRASNWVLEHEEFILYLVHLGCVCILSLDLTATCIHLFIFAQITKPSRKVFQDIYDLQVKSTATTETQPEEDENHELFCCGTSSTSNGSFNKAKGGDQEQDSDEASMSEEDKCLLASEPEDTDKNIYDQLENVMAQLNIFKREAFRERMGRVTAERKETEATRRAAIMESKYYDELKLRKEAEDAHAKGKEEIENMKQLLEVYKKERDDLQVERDNALGITEDLLKNQIEETSIRSLVHLEENQPPSSFICPISQEVMKDPHVAADGFTYEAEALREWLGSGHDTSPMTNLRLSHCDLIPNHALRSAIEEWLQQQT